MSDPPSFYDSILKDIRQRKKEVQQYGTSRSFGDDSTNGNKNGAVATHDAVKESNKPQDNFPKSDSKNFSKTETAEKEGISKPRRMDRRASVISSVENTDKLQDYLDYFENIIVKTKEVTAAEIIKDRSPTNAAIDAEIGSDMPEQFTEEQLGLTRKKFIMKIILIGDGAVGKTSLRRNYLGEGFESDYTMTIGADFAIKDTVLSTGIEIKYQLWDLAGQPIFKGVRQSYYQGCFGALVVFDLTRPRTFSNAILWINELWKHAGTGPIPIVFLGNKYDLVTGQIPVVEQAYRFCQTFSQETQRWKGFTTPFMITSAKSGLNVNQAFDLLGQNIFAWIANQQKSPDYKET